jgi:hypothetical protein
MAELVEGASGMVLRQGRCLPQPGIGRFHGQRVGPASRVEQEAAADGAQHGVPRCLVYHVRARWAALLPGQRFILVTDSSVAPARGQPLEECQDCKQEQF